MSDKSELPNNERMEGVLTKTFKGLHHAPKIKKHSNTHWEVNAHGGLSSFDNDSLTRLVIAAHDYAVRVEIKSSGPGLVRVCLWCRKRTGDGMERHPSIEEVLASRGDKTTQPEESSAAFDEWAGAPEWARFKATDKSGHKTYFEEKPLMMERMGIWVAYGSYAPINRDANPPPVPDWRKSLVERPTL